MASFLLGASIVIVTRKMGWMWLALLGLAAVYLVHYFWLTPSLSGTGGGENWVDAVILPWVGEEWRIYPLISLDKSMLHQAFLVLYWILFTVIGFWGNEKQDNPNMTFWLLLSNSFVFTSSYIHHLHVYYPTFKYLFPLGMGFVFLVLSCIEQRLNRRLLSDLYLAFSVSLGVLTFPMYFDGPWVTYGWSASLVVLTWLGVRHNRPLLYRIACVIAAVTMVRLVYFDYLEREILFTFMMPVRVSFLLFAVAASAFLAAFGIHRTCDRTNQDEKRMIENGFLIASALSFAGAFLIGGFRAASSVFWVFEGIVLMVFGVRNKRESLKISSALFMIFAALRIAVVDCEWQIVKVFLNAKSVMRLIAVMLAIMAVLGSGDWLRRKVKTTESRDRMFSYFLSIVGALLVMRYFYRPSLSAWVSIIWGLAAFVFIISGFIFRDRLYRWIGLGVFVQVLLRLFLHDFSQLETIYRIISFIGLGIVFIGASFVYNYYLKLLMDGTDNRNSSSHISSAK